MMGRWGLFVISLFYAPPLSHIPFTLRTSIFPWPSGTTPPLSNAGQARLRQLCIINILNRKKEKKERVSVDLGLTTTHLWLTCLLAAGAVCTRRTPIKNRWQNWLLLRGRQGQQTRTSRPIEIIEQPLLIYLFLSLYLICRWNQNARHEPVFLSPHTPATHEVLRGFDVLDFEFFLPALTFLENDFSFLTLSDLYWGQAVRQVAYKMSPFSRSGARRWSPVTWLTGGDGPWGPGRQMRERDGCLLAPSPPLHLHLPSSSPFSFFCVVCEMWLPSEWEGISKRLPRRDELRR